MKIREDEYRGFKYLLLFDHKGEFGEHKYCFYTECGSNFDGGFSKDMEKVENTIKKDIDNFYNALPKTEKQLLDSLEDCLIWTGYESCHLDRLAASKLITGFMESQRELA